MSTASLLFNSGKRTCSVGQVSSVSVSSISPSPPIGSSVPKVVNRSGRIFALNAAHISQFAMIWRETHILKIGKRVTRLEMQAPEIRRSYCPE
jgi:hypothetical protein